MVLCNGIVLLIAVMLSGEQLPRAPTDALSVSTAREQAGINSVEQRSAGMSVKTLKCHLFLSSAVSAGVALSCP